MIKISNVYRLILLMLFFTPGITLILTGSGTPPVDSKWLYGLTMLAISAASSVFFFVIIRRTAFTKAYNPGKIVTVISILFFLFLTVYIIIYNSQVVYSSKYDTRILFPLWYGEELRYMTSQAGNKLNAIINYGPQAVTDAINNAQPYGGITSMILVLLYQLVYTCLAAIFGVLGFNYFQSAPENSMYASPNKVQHTNVDVNRTAKSTTIKIFLASSAELLDDRNEFMKFINEENKHLNTKGLFLRLEQWEDFVDAMSQSRLQDEYNKVIISSDIFVCLIFTKVGRYTEEEFEKAMNNFKKTGKPFIYTYIKEASINISQISKTDIESKFRFENKLKLLGHFPSKYKNSDDLKYQFKKQLDKVLEVLP